jgi:hypothetical protein
MRRKHIYGMTVNGMTALTRRVKTCMTLLQAVGPPVVDACPTTLQTRVDGVLLAAQIALVACVALVAVILVTLVVQRSRRQPVTAR